MRVWKGFIFLSIFISIIYFEFINEKFQVVNELPAVIKKQFDVVLNERTKAVSLEKNGEYQSIGLSIDKDKTLYIANSVGYNIVKFTVNHDKKEIYIRKNILNFKNGDNDKFQLIEVPFPKYRDIAREDLINVYIDYGKGNELREYNLSNSEYKILGHADTLK